MPQEVKTTRQLRARNCRSILERIRTEGPISAARLSERCELRPSTISNILKDLRRQGCVRYCGFGSSTQQGGKRPLLIELDPEFGVLVGIEITSRLTRVVARDFALGELSSRSEDRVDGESIEVLASRLVEAALAEQGGVRLLGIGIGADAATLGGEEDADAVARRLGSRFACPVLIERHASVAACGEWVLDDRREARDLVYVELQESREDRSVDLGLILDGRIYHGRGAAGQLSSRAPRIGGDRPVEDVVQLVTELLDPALIVVGGELAGEVDVETLGAAGAGRTPPVIKSARFGDYAVAVGGVAMAFDEVLESMS